MRGGRGDFANRNNTPARAAWWAGIAWLLSVAALLVAGLAHGLLGG